VPATRYDVLWTVDSLGWKGTAPAVVVARCLAGAGNGVIYLFHVGTASTDADALQAVIDGLRARGLSIGTVPDVL
jgi:peptidoglycan-N-acetylglucosamine deacetylase